MPLSWSIGISVLMIVAGLLAIAAPTVAGLSVSILLAWLMLLSGGAHLGFAWHSRGGGGVAWEVLLGTIYVFVGGYLLFHPVAALTSLTAVLAVFLFVEAALEIFLSLQLRPLPGSGWLLLDGIITAISPS
jgi:uncharacterized membrane protein HdeD (DUF308 family)